MDSSNGQLRIIKDQYGELQIQNGTVLKYVGTAQELRLPKDVVRIAPYAFNNNKSLRKLTTPVKLASIGKGAFYGCDNLKEVTIPGILFRRVNGGKVFPTDTKIYFRFYANAGVELEDEDYSDIYESEEEYVASGVDDASMAFEKPEDKPAAPVYKDEVIDEKIITVEEELPEEPEPEDDEPEDGETLQEKMEAVIPPDSTYDEARLRRPGLVNVDDYLIDGDVAVKYIGSAKETAVPDFVTTIGENAFSNSDVTAVYLPDKLEFIGKDAFSWCTKLKEIYLPESLKVIEQCAFSNCESLEKITFPQNLKYIGANAFRACSALKEFTLPDSLSTISRRAFDFCVALEKVTVPANVTRLTEGVFSHCENLRKVTLPAGLIEIGAWAFADCYELREINFPDRLEDIREVAFLNCTSLIAFDLPMSVRTIGREAFVGCENLRIVNIPRRLEKQVKPTKAFARLKNLTINYVDEEMPPVE